MAPTAAATMAPTDTPTAEAVSWPEGIRAHAAASPAEHLGYLEYLPPDYDTDDTLRPLLIYLHGTPGGGDGSEIEMQRLLDEGIPKMLAAGAWPDELPFVVLAPQYSESDANSHCTFGDDLDQFLTEVTPEYRIDPARIYLIGHSCGAIGIWEFLAAARVNKVAAVVPIASAPYPHVTRGGCELAQTPMWAFHGALDDLIPVHFIEDAVADLRECTDPPPADLKLTIVPGGHHDVDTWEPAYDLSSGHDIYDWMLAHTASQQ